MSGIHTGVRQGTTVKILFKDGRGALITKFKEEKSAYVLTEDGKIPIKEMRSMMIYKPLTQQDK